MFSLNVVLRRGLSLVKLGARSRAGLVEATVADAECCGGGGRVADAGREGFRKVGSGSVVVRANLRRTRLDSAVEDVIC
jgi:hypothetical protein